MSSKANIELSHGEIEELIPLYLNGKLSSDLQRRMQEHIAHCEHCFRAQQDTELVRQLLTPPPAGLQPLLAQPRMAANIERTLANIDHAELGPVVGRPSAGLQGVKRWWLALRASAVPVRLTLLAQSALVVMAIGLMLWSSNGPREIPLGYQTQSASVATALPAPPEDSLRYRVVFKPEASEQSMRELLINVGGRLYDGPSAMGVYTIIVPASPGRNTEILGRLRDNPSVMLAERAVYRDR